MRICTIALALILAAPCFAQTTGVVGANDLTVNGGGSGTTSINTVNLQGGPQIIDLAAAVGAGDQIVLAGGNPAVGLLPVNATDTLDIDLSAGIIYDSAGLLAPGPAFPFPTGANSAGNWAMSFSADMAVGNISLQIGIFSATVPGGVAVSQAHDLVVSPPAAHICPSTIGGSLTPLSDDGFIQVPLNAAVTFYGVVYSDLWVNMNGNITFGSGSGDFSSSEAEMLSQQPRIAPAWADWTPSDVLQGDVAVFQDGSHIEVEWYDVRHFGCGGIGDRNTFCATIDFLTGDITFLYDEMRLCNNTRIDQLVGVSPGGNPIGTPISAANNVDLWDNITPASVTNSGVNPTDAVYEDFNQGLNGPFDLGVTWGVNSGILISAGGGAGPYVLTSF